MIVCVPVTADGRVGHSWGRADRVAVAEVSPRGIDRWEEFDVGWNHLHDEESEGGHHARIARFLTEHGVEHVVSGHMGPPMEHMLAKLGIAVRLGADGDAREAAMASAGR